MDPIHPMSEAKNRSYKRNLLTFGPTFPNPDLRIGFQSGSCVMPEFAVKLNKHISKQKPTKRKITVIILEIKHVHRVNPCNMP